MKTTEYFKDKPELVCNKCKRKSVSHAQGQIDLMTQPNGRRCFGTFQIL